ncbi:DEAD/DEAH box helicase family protein [Fuchsiella alkaliacetigena]|uniref:DEAD/DEAH box helicase family protein n=1 Tax=Fuchsiella alkaliacetigena TaxID=957042 RepID=UPI00200B9531|nr:DEAD/DEAH box helicase family protein [Fuchsiella alkaliacetigena]MCK8825196.1 DEAD/DEAH box helicase family protein [Fuchsiella alkaliacetigena]
MRLQKRLILNKYFLSLFGVEEFEGLREVVIDADEGFNAEGNSYILTHLLSSKLQINNKLQIKLEEFDQEIKQYVEFINKNRDQPIVLKYFQYLAVLFTEIFLDKYFNNKELFKSKLNNFINKENSKIKKDKNKYSPFYDEDLNKVAFYMATGSGKTLIMHINYLQYLKYNYDNLDKIILITPNEGLSDQHLKEFKKSNIQADLLLNMIGGLIEEKKVYVIEITKLVENKTREGDSIEVSSLEGNNLILVDEGHKGSGGDVWKKNREYLAEDGFIFEYSATFGQAVEKRIDRSEKWKNEDHYFNKKVEKLNLPEDIKTDIFNIIKHNTYINMSLYQLEKKMDKYDLSLTMQQRIRNLYNNLLEEYSKAIIFDYSYKYFHEDGYGKDYSILNLKSSQLQEYNSIFLLANLLSFFEKKIYFKDQQEQIKEYNIKNPLLLFVGHTVSASSSLTKNDKASISDLEFIIEFINEFLNNKNEIISAIDDILAGDSGFVDSNEEDIFANRYSYLKERAFTGKEIYRKMLKLIFNTSLNLSSDLQLYEVKKAAGEIGLKLKGAEDYFALINIGNVNKLKRKLKKNNINISEDNFSDSFFAEINNKNSKINMLIGSKKFTEGWDSYRVANIGLLNIGRKEGSQIIQLFGRGVRLKGLNNSLQRSSAFAEKKHPEHIQQLETLDIFGIKADYMEKFEEYLQEEGIETDAIEKIELPIKENEEFLREDLLSLDVKEGLDFRKDVNLNLDVDENYKVQLDLRPKMEQLNSKKRMNGNIKNDKNNPQEIDSKILNYLDWDKIYLDTVSYKIRKGFTNLSIKKEALKLILEKKLYNLYCNREEDIKANKFTDLDKITDIVKKILNKYISKFYRDKLKKYKSDNLVYKPLSKEDDNFKNYTLQIKKKNEDLVKKIKKLVKDKEEIYDARLEGIDEIDNVYFDRHLFQPLLGDECEIETVTPVALNKSEKRFIKMLKEYFINNKDIRLLADKKVFLLRNLPKLGIGFFEANNYYPDFILWIKEKDKQYINFIDPKGLRNLHNLSNPKIRLAKDIKEIQNKLKGSRSQDVFLNSFIISNTPFNKAKRIFKIDTKNDFEAENIYFEEDGLEIINKMIKKALR